MGNCCTRYFGDKKPKAQEVHGESSRQHMELQKTAPIESSNQNRSADHEAHSLVIKDPSHFGSPAESTDQLIEWLSDEEVDKTRYFRNPFPDYTTSTNWKRFTEAEAKSAITEIVQKIQKVDKELLDEDIEGGIYQGPAGIAYGLLHVHSTGLFSKNENGPVKRDTLLRIAQKLCKDSVEHIEAHGKPEEAAGFLMGHAGVFAVDAAVAHTMGDTERTIDSVDRYRETFDTALTDGTNREELMVGRAGWVLGAIWLNRILVPNAVKNRQIVLVCEKMVHSGIEFSEDNRSPSPLLYEYYGTTYLGAAHGLCSILQVILSVPNYVPSRPPVLRAVQESMKFLLSTQTPEGNFPSSMEETEGIGKPRDSEEELTQWCHGAPGFIPLLAIAYFHLDRIYKKELLAAALKCGDFIWKKGLLVKGPGLCHGIAGNGYAFLLLYRWTGDLKHLYRATCFARFLKSETFRAKARIPDHPLSLFEGQAGTACFLADLAKPNEAHFPFFEIKYKDAS